jgi:uncharacterized protein DUF5681
MDPVSKAQLANNSEKIARLKQYSWKPGQTGNPRGRPKKLHITKMFEKVLANPENRKQVQEAIFKELCSRGMAKVLLLREIAERTEGKITQEVDLNVTVALADTIAQRRLKRVNDDSES